MRSRLILLLAFALLVAPAMCAQQSQAKPQKPLDPRDVEALTGKPFNASQAEAKQEPNAPKSAQPAKSRPPMDWRDVDILTGKHDRDTRPRRAYMQPYYYFDVSPYGSLNYDTQLDDVGRDTGSFLAPRSFGRRSGQFVLWNPRVLGPSVFSPRRTFRGSVFVF